MDPVLQARLARQAQKASADANAAAEAQQALEASVARTSRDRVGAAIVDAGLAARLARQARKAADASEGARAQQALEAAVSSSRLSSRHSQDDVGDGITDARLAARLSQQASKAETGVLETQGGAVPPATASPRTHWGAVGAAATMAGGRASSGESFERTISTIDPKLAARLARQAGKADGTVEAASFDLAERPREVDPSARQDRPSDELASRLSRQAARASGAHMRGAKMMFELYDLDGDGSIDGDELTAMLEALQLDPSEQEKVMGALDLDRSGTLEFNEFFSWWELGLRMDALDNLEANLKRVRAERIDQLRAMRTSGGAVAATTTTTGSSSAASSAAGGSPGHRRCSTAAELRASVRRQSSCGDKARPERVSLASQRARESQRSSRASSGASSGATGAGSAESVSAPDEFAIAEAEAERELAEDT